MRSRSAIRLVLLIFLALVGAPTGAQRAAAQAPATTGCVTDIDHERLPALLAARGFTPPEQFKALVITLGAAPDKTCQAFDWHGSARDRGDWWPASSVKLFAAVAALEHARSLGFGPSVKLTYHYADGDVEESLEGLVRKALIPSDNKAFDRLVELVGFDRLHERFFTPSNGLPDTVFLRSYSGRIRDPKTHKGINRHSPAITLAQGDRSHDLPEQTGKLARECPDQGNCTTLLELSEALRRVMLHEELPKAQRFALDAEDLKLLRLTLATPRAQSMNVVDGLRAGLGAAELPAYHKPGFALRWMSDVVFIETADTHQRYIVALAGYPGRESLDAASRAIGELLASGALRLEPRSAPAADMK
jgi:hypothetical protein